MEMAITYSLDSARLIDQGERYIGGAPMNEKSERLADTLKISEGAIR